MKLSIKLHEQYLQSRLTMIFFLKTKLFEQDLYTVITLDDSFRENNYLIFLLNLFQAMIREADIDNDGKISFEEFRTVMKTWNIPIEKKTVHSKITFFYLSISLDLSNQKVSCSMKTYKCSYLKTWEKVQNQYWLTNKDLRSQLN